jgi:hypothetical protein
MVGPIMANIADYADALITARKTRNVLVLLLLLMLFFQLALFFTVRYKVEIVPGNPPAAASRASVRQTPPAVIDVLKYLTGLIDFAGVVVPLVLAVNLWFIVSVMLVGRLLGVSRLVSAFFWCILLLVLLFPWQAFLMNQTFTSNEFKIPGVLYTWSELAVRGRLHPQGISLAILYWARFVGWPILAIVIVVIVQHQSRTGLRLAMGESSAPAVKTPAPEA